MAGVSETVLGEGADAYLAKPFKVKELISQVEHLLRSETAITPSA
jgi:DNA-binding response OmpR family regulator